MSRKQEILAAKVHRLYRQHQASLEELKHQQRLMKEAQTRLNLAMSKEHSARDDYNQALAEYKESTLKND